MVIYFYCQLWICIVIFSSAFTADSESIKPDAIIPTINGQDVLFSCAVKRRKIGDKDAVVWMDQHDNVLFYNNVTIIDDSNFRLKIDPDGEQWNLQIVSVTPEHEGRYRCVANTSPVVIKYYELIVYVPPQIDIKSSSQDLEATEGSTAIFFCNVTGHPTPEVKWSVRPTNQTIPNANRVQYLETVGSPLIVNNLSRHLNVTYTCWGMNGYGEPASHDMRLLVRFRPKITRMESKVSRDKGDTVTMVCYCEGYPLPNVYFAKDNLQIKIPDDNRYKYSYDNERMTHGYGIKLMFTITNLSKEDFGYYKCVGVNALGRFERFVELIDMTPMKPTPLINQQEDQRWKNSWASTKSWKFSTPTPRGRSVTKMKPNQKPLSLTADNDGSSAMVRTASSLYIICCLVMLVL